MESSQSRGDEGRSTDSCCAGEGQVRRGIEGVSAAPFEAVACEAGALVACGNVPRTPTSAMRTAAAAPSQPVPAPTSEIRDAREDVKTKGMLDFDETGGAGDRSDGAWRTNGASASASSAAL